MSQSTPQTNEIEESSDKDGSQQQHHAIPQMGASWVAGVMTVTSVDALDVVLDFIFAARLIVRGGSENIGYGVWLIVCLTWATIIAIQSKRYLSGRAQIKPEDEAQMNFAVLFTEATIFFVEDCTLVMVIAAVDDAYDSKDIGNVLTVALSVASALITIVAFSLFLRDFVKDRDGYGLILLLGLIPAFFFGYLLIRLLVQDGLSDLGLGLRIVAWVLYSFQLAWAIFLSLAFFGLIEDE